MRCPNHQEAELLDHYHAQLVAALVEFEAAEDAAAAAALLSRDQLQHQYEVAVLDMCRSVLTDHNTEQYISILLTVSTAAGRCSPTTGFVSRRAPPCWRGTLPRWAATATTRASHTRSGSWPPAAAPSNTSITWPRLGCSYTVPKTVNTMTDMLCVGNNDNTISS